MLIAIVFFSSCKKDLRTKTYPLRAFNNSGFSGQVSFIETKDADSTLVKVEAHGLVPGTVYPTHLHIGNITSLISTIIHYANVQSSTGNFEREDKWGETFDNALNSNTCFTMHIQGYTNNDTSQYVLAGNLGASAE